MYIKSIKINNFRAFKNGFSMTLGKKITAIAGPNGTGKSTILGLLANSAEIKGYKTLNQKKFRGEIGEIIAYDEQHDIHGKLGASCSIEFNNINNIEDNILNFRTLLQKIENGTDRFRFIPDKKDKRKTEAKLSWPIIYLGLSRIYPIGESNKATPKSVKEIEFTQKVIKKHKELMSEHIDVSNSNISMISLDSAPKKPKFGIDTDQYSSVSNSSGQDSLGQIIMAVYSFQKLKQEKESKGETYNGGFLGIDEIDVTLHPEVQNKLLKWLLCKSKQLDLQIVFTTHSINLLTTIKSRFHRDIAIRYLKKDNIKDKIKAIEDPHNSLIKNNLLNIYQAPTKQKIKVFTEDNIARYFIKNIIDSVIKYDDIDNNDNVDNDIKNIKKIDNELSSLVNNLDFLETSISWKSLISIAKSDFNYYENSLFILDPDLKLENNFKKFKELLYSTEYRNNFDENFQEKDTSNIKILPGENAIEKMMWEYLCQLESDAPFFENETIYNSNFTKDLAMNTEYGPNINIKGTAKYKKWFEDNKWVVDILLQYWISDNRELVTKFKKRMINTINNILNKNSLI